MLFISTQCHSNLEHFLIDDQLKARVYSLLLGVSFEPDSIIFWFRVPVLSYCLGCERCHNKFYQFTPFPHPMVFWWASLSVNFLLARLTPTSIPSENHVIPKNPQTLSPPNRSVSSASPKRVFISGLFVVLNAEKKLITFCSRSHTHSSFYGSIMAVFHLTEKQLFP